MDTLVPGVNATHDVLRHRLSMAETASPDRQHPRDHYRAIDTFLASASRHHSAVLEVLVPAARQRGEEGERLADEFVHQDKQLEIALAQVKAKLYGSTYVIRRSWRSIWHEVRREFETTWRLERELVEALGPEPDEGDPDWGERLYRAELAAPTRPHPFVPHRGLRGRIARRVALRVDRFWDATEGRMIPEPVHPHDRDHDGRLTQYLLADPHLAEE